MTDNIINSSNFEQARNFLEIKGLNAIRQQSKESDGESKKAALQEAAQQFEAIFMQMLLKSMRKAQDVLESDSPFNSQSTKFYRDMSDQQMAVELSSNGSLGLTDLIVRQLGGDSDNFTPRNVLRNDATLEHVRKANTKSNNSVDNPNEQAFNIDNPFRVLSKTNDNAESLHANLTRIPFVPTRKENTMADEHKPSVNFSTPSFTEPKDFVTALTAGAKIVQDKINVPFEVVIAQAALETGWGQKIIKTDSGQSSNNLFNIKADSRWSGDKTQKETLEFENGAMVKKREPFRVYDSIEQSVNDYVNLLTQNERYQGALEKSENVEHFLQGLQQAGYATDPQYANKIMATLRTVTSLISK